MKTLEEASRRLLMNAINTIRSVFHDWIEFLSDNRIHYDSIVGNKYYNHSYSLPTKFIQSKIVFLKYS